MKALNGPEYKGRPVRCNDADEEGHGRAARGGRDAEGRSGRGGRSVEKGSRGRRGSDDARSERGGRGSRGGKKARREEETGDWRQFFQNNDNVKFKGEEPNFEEEGWARRRPKKK